MFITDSFLGHHEVADATTVEVGNIAVTVVTLGFQSKEQRLLRETKGAAVSEQPPYLCIGIADTSRSNERRNFLDVVIHSAKLLYFFRISSTFNNVLSMKA